MVPFKLESSLGKFDDKKCNATRQVLQLLLIIFS